MRVRITTITTTPWRIAITTTASGATITTRGSTITGITTIGIDRQVLTTDRGRARRRIAAGPLTFGRVWIGAGANVKARHDP
jgi:hypothetical protein